ncbi:OVARIAN TUMOR DOMAIN-containing deubiquitinating enzyme 12 isoform X2 [Malania oleifera]|nr:OVARIAN TUMOR DOMAIN-containing deubiquitinating enzyme 12 isoform X2 [Malania oleifera]
MINYELDPDIVRWGLHLLDVCSLSHNGSCSGITQYAADPCPVEYIREGYCRDCEAENINVENDEVIAHALQEEFSHLASVEASGSSHVENEQMQASVLAQDWISPSRRHSSTVAGPQNGEEEVDGMGISCSCSGLGEKLVNNDDCTCCLEIEDESTLDGEVGKRLNQMNPVPHVPKINGEIPSVDEETSDHQRLLDRLKLYDLVEFKVQGDGNCQFRALSDQIYRTPEHHKFVRQEVFSQLKAHREMYEGYVPMAYGDYLNKISKNGEWGDHVTLQAAADSYGFKIFVITSFKDTCYIEILPQIQKSNRVISLSFWAEVHYNSIYPAGGKHLYDDASKLSWHITRVKLGTFRGVKLGRREK